MSYDIYCYRSTLGYPDVDEASDIIDNEYDWDENEARPATKLAIVKALTTFNPKLEAFDFDYGAIAELTQQTIEEAKEKFDHIELNPPEGGLAIQLIVYDNYVFITIPYWYKGEQAKQVMTNVKSYIDIICKQPGYFVYDPQIDVALDTGKTDYDPLAQYLPTSEYVATMLKPTEELPKEPVQVKKPWWKFW